ncbi:MAG: hypothetical protein EXR69_01685 [Myxococcales bacterium]|nr:hypothetical protein [Myxococcales bacterium]
MASLKDVISDPNKRKKVVDDGVTVIEAEVSDKGGLSGLAIKAAYGTVKRIKPGFVGGALNHLLDDFAGKVDPFWNAAVEKGGDPATTFVSQGANIAEALLSITDARARAAVGPVRKTYDQLRPQASKHVVEAMPRLAGLLKKHAV